MLKLQNIVSKNQYSPLFILILNKPFHWLIKQINVYASFRPTRKTFEKGSTLR